MVKMLEMETGVMDAHGPWVGENVPGQRFCKVHLDHFIDL